MSHSNRITTALLQSLADIVQSSGATAIFVYADAVGHDDLPLLEAFQDKVYFIFRSSIGRNQQLECTRLIRVPDVAMTRLGQVKMAVFLALSRGLVQRGDIIVCLTGVSSSGSLDSIIITEVGRESEIFASASGETRLPNNILPQVVERVIDIAAELGNEGREGKPVGALFVVGDAEKVVSLSRQLIINPFKGYDPSERNVLDPRLEETMKELSTIDGAFIISGEGVVETCGAYLRTAAQDEEEYSLPQGLGARHHSAAGITSATDSIAITVSESTGTVAVFRGGRMVTAIEKPRSFRP